MRGGTGVIFNNTITGTWWAEFAVDNVRSLQDREGGGLADGTSPWDGNTPGGEGYPARDQIGRSTDQWLWTDDNPYPPQALDPAYSWNNTYNGGFVNFFVHNGGRNEIHIQEGRDFYNNTEKPGYTPFTYPHPLVTED